MNNVHVIFHIDMNAFFASCEEIKRPFLADKPFAIGTRYSSKGVLSTANYVARKFGIHSAMSVKDALKKCPELIIVDGNYELYEKCSHNFMKILLEYTDKVEQASIDEAYLDVTDVNKHPLELAKELQSRILNECKLPCSIGIGPNLFLAKMASDMKKPLGITVLRKRDIKTKLYPLDIDDFFGIGKKTSPKLKEMGINTIGDLALEIDNLADFFGDKFYEDIKRKLFGKSNDIVDKDRYSSFSSIGNSRTANQPLVTEEDNYGFIEYVTRLVSKRLVEKRVVAYTITVQIKYTDFKVFSRSQTLNDPIKDYLTLLDNTKSLFDELWNHEPVRLIGVSASNLEKENEKKFDLFHLNNLENEENIRKTMEELEKKYGKNAIKKGI